MAEDSGTLRGARHQVVHLGHKEEQRVALERVGLNHKLATTGIELAILLLHKDLIAGIGGIEAIDTILILRISNTGDIAAIDIVISAIVLRSERVLRVLTILKALHTLRCLSCLLILKTLRSLRIICRGGAVYLTRALYRHATLLLPCGAHLRLRE